MGKVYDQISDELSEWIGEQHMFFVATAPLAADGLVNCSPKGLDSFRILGPNEVAYLDLTGSGVETVAHLKENGRIVIMFCAFTGGPKIVRFHGTGQVFRPDQPEFEELIQLFPPARGARSIIKVQVSRVSDSCGFAVPKFEYVEERKALTRWADSKSPEGIAEYQREKNSQSLDGLTGV